MANAALKISVRDDFTQGTKELLAKRAGYLCSNPKCRASTIGAAAGHDGFVNVGVAGHITAAAPGGPRYDPSLTAEQRRHHSNGIWLCQTHGKLVDSDSAHFTVNTLHEWKRGAERRSFLSIAALSGTQDEPIEPVAAEPAVQEVRNRLGLSEQDDVDSVTARLLRAAATDLAAFKRMPGWPRHAVTLNLRITDDVSSRAFHVSGLAAALRTFNEITITAAPGTGKTTTLLQVAEAIILEARCVPLFVPLGEWSSQSETFFGSVLRRGAFHSIREQHLMLLAHYGYLALVLDGWNELDSSKRRRATVEIKQLRREFPRLGVIISTRRQALDVPISGIGVEIDILNEDQQLEIARALRGDGGEALLDHAWRTPGVHDLISIPLYLTALLANAPGGIMPTTKEEVLRLFIAEHERGVDKAEALREVLFGFHPQMLTALAVEATCSGNTALPDSRARAVVRRVEDDLSVAGQISIVPQPSAVIDVLVNHHTLVRSGADMGALSFQHQQFQEWYASFEVERAMCAAAAGDENARRQLRFEFLNQRPWEEAVLFACERVSRMDGAGADVTAATVLWTLPIDPMFAAEMISRSSATLWERVLDNIISFAARWHTPGTVDRAVRFMITSGRAEFADQMWPLIANPDTQVHLSALRAARRFRPSVLGPDLAQRIARIPEETRKNVLAEIAMRCTIDGVALATDLARADPSPAVQLAVVQSLQFRRADRHVTELLEAACPEVWPLLARKGYADEIADTAAADRLRAEWRRQIEAEFDPLRRMGLLLETASLTQSDGEQIKGAIESADFQAGDQHAMWPLHQAFKRCPDQVASALIRRLETGRDVPFDAEKFVANVASIDEGPVATAATDISAPKRLGHVAATVVGPNTVGALIDRVMTLADGMTPGLGTPDATTAEQYHIVRDRIAATRPSSFFTALLSRGNTDRPVMIGVLSELVARHGNENSREQALAVDYNLLHPLIALVHQWVETLLMSPESKRHQLAEVATAIGRLGRPELVPDLRRLLDADLLRWRRARQGYGEAPSRASMELRSDAGHSWTLQYRLAFASICGDQVVQLMGEYLEDNDFGFDAACVLKTAWDREQKMSKPDLFKRWPDLSSVKARRVERHAQIAPRPTSPIAEMIFSAIERLVQQGGDNRERLAIMLGRIALSIPHGDKTAVVNALLALPQPIRMKRELLAALILDGEIISADVVLEGVHAWLADAREHTWRFHEGLWEVEGWLELLPFTDRPAAATIEGVELVNRALPRPHRMERVVWALGNAPDEEVGPVLAELVRRHPQLASQHEWIKAIVARDTVAAGIILVDLVLDGSLTTGPGAADRWWISEQLAALTRVHPELRAMLLRRYGDGISNDAAQQVIERVLSEIGDAECVLALVRGYARNAKRFDGLIHAALENVALDKRPATGWVGAYELHPVPISALRKEFFRMLEGTPHEAALGAACLIAIDELRDEYGPAEFESRHPDVESGRPWPLAATS